MRRFTLKKWEILRGRKAIREAFATSKTIFSDRFLVLRYAPSTQKKALFAVERKVRKATERNRIKRKLREFYRKNKHRFPSGIWIFIGKRELANVKGEFYTLSGEEGIRLTPIRED